MIAGLGIVTREIERSPERILRLVALRIRGHGGAKLLDRAVQVLAVEQLLAVPDERRGIGRLADDERRQQQVASTNAKAGNIRSNYATGRFRGQFRRYVFTNSTQQ